MPSESRTVFKHFVDRCLREKGYDPIDESIRPPSFCSQR